MPLQPGRDEQRGEQDDDVVRARVAEPRDDTLLVCDLGAAEQHVQPVIGRDEGADEERDGEVPGRDEELPEAADAAGQDGADGDHAGQVRGDDAVVERGHRSSRSSSHARRTCASVVRTLPTARRIAYLPFTRVCERNTSPVALTRASSRSFSASRSSPPGWPGGW